MTELNELTIERPISGDINRSSTSRSVQGTAAEFLEKLDAILATEHVVGVIWDQYIPYFNDGEPCEFGFGEIRVLLDDSFAEDIDEDMSDYGDKSLSPSDLFTYGDLAGERPAYASYNDTAGRDAYQKWSDIFYSDANKKFFFNENDTKAIYDAFRAFNVDSFEDVARANFGDHATVTVTKDGFSVAYYDHD